MTDTMPAENNRRVIITGGILLIVVLGALWWYFASQKSANQLENAGIGQTKPATSTQTAASTTAPATTRKTAAPAKTAATSTTTKAVKSIALTASSLTNVSWKTTGYSKYGYYLVWSQNIHPTYPPGKGGSYRLYSDPAANWGSILTSGKKGVFYVRVCENLGATCGTYSNDVSISL